MRRKDECRELCQGKEISPWGLGVRWAKKSGSWAGTWGSKAYVESGL